MKLPALPTELFSVLGAVSVGYMRRKKARKQALCGEYDYCDRSITIRPGMKREAEWVTLWHEATHVALMDAGVHGNVLTKEQEESVCDAMGTYLAAMTKAGALVFTQPHRKDSGV